MLTRRHFLLASAALAPGLAAAPALAISTEPMPAGDIEALNLACSNAAPSHEQLVAETRQMLDGEVKLGLRPANYDTIVTCPLCHCSLRVVPDITF